MPTASVVGAVVWAAGAVSVVSVSASPASMAGLPGSRANVWVGPPLLVRAPRPGLVTPTKLPLLPSTSPPAPPMPIRLLIDAAVFTIPPPLMSPPVLPATIVFRSTGVEVPKNRPPPEMPLPTVPPLT